MSSRKTVLLHSALVLVSAFSFSLACAQPPYHPCTRATTPGNERQNNYPVVVYDADSRRAFLAYKSNVVGHLNDAVTTKTISPVPADQRPLFLCAQYPVEIFVINRRLKTDFTVSLTAAIKAQAGHLSVAGLIPPGTTSPPSTTPSAPSGGTTPSTKGFNPSALGNLLTTDVIINDLLNEETFDRPLARIRDDASAVVAQAAQLQGNYIAYRRKINQLLRNPDPVDPEGNISIAAAQQEFHAFAHVANDGTHAFSRHVDDPIANEKDFDDLLEQADRLQQEITRLNSQLQGYPFVDVLVNLRASAATLRDNIRGVLTEYYSLYLAINILENFNNGPAAKKQYLRERRMAEIRSMLRNQFPSATTIDELTLARIVEGIENNELSLTDNLALDQRLMNLNCSLGIDNPPQADCADTPANRAKGVPSPPPNLARRFVDRINDSMQLPPGMIPGRIADNQLDYIPPTGPIPYIGFTNAFTDENDGLQGMRNGITTTNDEVAAAYRGINQIYDISFAPPVELPFDLTPYGKNLNVYYTIAGLERFHRYQILNETPQPQSACALADSANTSTSGGSMTCTTATLQPLPVAGITFSTTVPLYAVGAGGGFGATPASAPTSASPSAAPSSSQGGPSQTASSPPTSASAPTPLSDFHGFFQLHHFTEAELITGAAFDSITSSSYSWITCPINSKYPSGSTDPATCASFQTTSSSGAVTTTNYYMLTQSKQAPIAAIQGINIFAFGPKDEFLFTPENLYAPDVFLGAAAYPVGHFYLGLSETPVRGLSVTFGLSVGSQTYLPSSSNYQMNTVYTTNPSIPTSSHFQKGFFVMVGFRTALFKGIFNGSAFQNVIPIGTAGAPTSQASQ